MEGKWKLRVFGKWERESEGKIRVGPTLKFSPKKLNGENLIRERKP